MNIKIKFLNGFSLYFTIKPNQTIKDIKYFIKQKMYIFPQRQVLIYCGQKLKDNFELKLLNNATVIHCVIIEENKFWNTKIKKRKEIINYYKNKLKLCQQINYDNINKLKLIIEKKNIIKNLLYKTNLKTQN